jgi:site-specific recombinase XerD
MATVRLKFRPSTIGGKEGTLYYRITQNRVSRQVSTGFKISESEWNAQTESFLSNVASDERESYINKVETNIVRNVRRLNKIIHKMDISETTYTADDIINTYIDTYKRHTLFIFMTDTIHKMKQLGRVGTSENYISTLNSFIRFRNGEDVALDEVDSTMMIEYESYLKNSGVTLNSSSFYMRNLRSVYNMAVEQSLVSQSYPFKHVYTGIGKTAKRAVQINIIKRLRRYDLSNEPSLAFARDLFLFSFYTRGMSTVDMANLKKSDLSHGILTYRRQKTDQRLAIRWEECMQDIIDKYTIPSSRYLLPIIKSEGREREQYKNFSHQINRRLKTLGQLMELPMPLTMYVARHTWASVAQSRNIPLSVISNGLGHDSEKTTRIYLASLDTVAVDRANRQILNLLF